jgi:hypothetical protein
MRTQPTTSSVFDLSTMTRRDKYLLASKLIDEISNEWTDAENAETWQKQNVLNYESSMSFDELAAEIRSVEFK